MHRTTFFLTFLLLISSLYAQGWGKKETSQYIRQNEFLGMDFSTSASEIKWTITCSSEPCLIYLLTFDNFIKLQQGTNFDYLIRAERILQHSGSWDSKSDIQQRLVILAINMEPTSTYVTIEIEQFIPPSTGSTNRLLWMIPIVCVVSFIICCCTVCGIVACVVRNIRDENPNIPPFSHNWNGYYGGGYQRQYNHLNHLNYGARSSWS
jgi:hypothetical protein